MLRGVIRIGTIGGAIDVNNATGDIEILAAKAGVRAVAQVGDIAIGFDPQLTADADVSVSGGNLYAAVHPKTACRLDAKATWGQVRNSLSLTIESGGNGKRSLRGAMNGGGPLISLRASGGSVSISSDFVSIDGD